jgi:carbonic anhydrase
MSLDVLREGVRRFRTEEFPRQRAMFEELAERQRPFALFLTCGDSRIDPLLLTGANPGQLFVERTPGNIVPIYKDDVAVGVSASIEYAVTVLRVTDVIICGHSGCGGMHALLDPEHLKEMPATARWLAYAKPAVEKLGNETGEERLERLVKLNVIQQMSHLITHPSVQARASELTIHGWYYEIHDGVIEAFDPSTGWFAPWPPG